MEWKLYTPINKTVPPNYTLIIFHILFKNYTRRRKRIFEKYIRQCGQGIIYGSLNILRSFCSYIMINGRNGITL